MSYYISHDEIHTRAEPDLMQNPGAASNHAVIVSIADTRSMIIIDKEKSRKITVIVIITDLDDLIVVIQTNIIDTRKPDAIDRPDHFLL